MFNKKNKIIFGIFIFIMSLFCILKGTNSNEYDLSMQKKSTDGDYEFRMDSLVSFYTGKSIYGGENYISEDNIFKYKDSYYCYINPNSDKYNLKISESLSNSSFYDIDGKLISNQIITDIDSCILYMESGCYICPQNILLNGDSVDKIILIAKTSYFSSTGVVDDDIYAMEDNNPSIYESDDIMLLSYDIDENGKFDQFDFNIFKYIISNTCDDFKIFNSNGNEFLNYELSYYKFKDIEEMFIDISSLLTSYKYSCLNADIFDGSNSSIKSLNFNRISNSVLPNEFGMQFSIKSGLSSVGAFDYTYYYDNSNSFTYADLITSIQSYNASTAKRKSLNFNLIFDSMSIPVSIIWNDISINFDSNFQNLIYTVKFSENIGFKDLLSHISVIDDTDGVLQYYINYSYIGEYDGELITQNFYDNNYENFSLNPIENDLLFVPIYAVDNSSNRIDSGFYLSFLDDSKPILNNYIEECYFNISTFYFNSDFYNFLKKFISDDSLIIDYDSFCSFFNGYGCEFSINESNPGYISISSNDSLFVSDLFEDNLKVGTYELILNIYDKYNNVNSYSFNLIFNDDSIVSSERNVIYLFNTEKMLIADDLFNFLNISYTYCNFINFDIVDTNKYFYNSTNLTNQYNFTINCYFSYGVSRSFDLTLNVIDNTLPVISFDNFFEVYTDNKLSGMDIISLFTQASLYDSSYQTIEIVSNEYQSNYSNPGTYEVVAKVSYLDETLEEVSTNVAINLSVVDKLVDDSEIEKEDSNIIDKLFDKFGKRNVYIGCCGLAVLLLLVLCSCRKKKRH